MADVEAVTEVVVTVKVALVAPAGTVTLNGTVAAVELHERETDPPPVGAGALKVTVPVDEAPPTTLVGLNDTVERTGPGGGRGAGVSVRPALEDTPSVAVMMTNVVAPTGLVFTGKVALFANAGTATLGGTVANPELLESVTTAPAAPASTSRVTVPVEALPLTTMLGVSPTQETAGGFTNSRAPAVAPS